MLHPAGRGAGCVGQAAGCPLKDPAPDVAAVAGPLPADGLAGLDRAGRVDRGRSRFPEPLRLLVEGRRCALAGAAVGKLGGGDCAAGVGEPRQPADAWSVGRHGAEVRVGDRAGAGAPG